MTRVVSVTPLGLEVDSRTLKEAMTMARVGHESVVVQARRRMQPALSRTLEVRSTAPQPRPGSPPSDGFKRWLRPTSSRILRGLRLPVELLLVPFAYLRLAWRTVRATPSAALYYLHSFEQFPAVWWLSRRHRVPFVYDAHDMYSVLFQPNPLSYPERLEGRIRAALERACVRRAAAFVTVSEGVADLYEGSFGRRPIVIRNCHDLRMDEPIERDIRRETGVSDDVVLLVVSGNRKSGMALEAMLSALLRLPTRVHLAFVGGGWQSLCAEVAELGLDGRVHLLEARPPTGIVPFIRSADLAPIPYYEITSSHRSSLPNGLFHAIAAGLPILYSASLPEVAALCTEHDLGPPIEPRDPASLRRTVGMLLERPEEVARLRGNVEEAAKVLSWEREEAALASLVGRLLEGERA